MWINVSECLLVHSKMKISREIYIFHYFNFVFVLFFSYYHFHVILLFWPTLCCKDQWFTVSYFSFHQFFFFFISFCTMTSYTLFVDFVCFFLFSAGSFEPIVDLFFRYEVWFVNYISLIVVQASFHVLLSLTHNSTYLMNSLVSIFFAIGLNYVVFKSILENNIAFYSSNNLVVNVMSSDIWFLMILEICSIGANPLHAMVPVCQKKWFIATF